MIYGITGTSRLLTPTEVSFVHRTVKRVVLRRAGNKLVSGMAFGVDTEAILAVWGQIPFENIVCVVPGTCNHNRALAESCVKLGAQLVVVPNRHTVGATYLARDDEIAEIIQTLLAFPQRKTFYRSGTWATINRANRKSRRVRMYPLSAINNK